MTVTVQEVVEGFRLSPQQKRIWLLQESEQPYCVSCSVLIEGRLDREALNSAINEVMERHEILRTTYKRLSGMSVPLQGAWSVLLSRYVGQEEVVKQVRDDDRGNRPERRDPAPIRVVERPRRMQRQSSVGEPILSGHDVV